MDSISPSATPECLESSEQAKHQKRPNFGRMPHAFWPFSGCHIFISQNFHVSHPLKPWPEPQTLSPSKGTVRMAAGGEAEKYWRTCYWQPWYGLLWGLASHFGLAPPAPDGSFSSPQGTASPSCPPQPWVEVKGRSPNGYNRTLKKESGHFTSLLDADWFWFRSPDSSPPRRQKTWRPKTKRWNWKGTWALHQ